MLWKFLKIGGLTILSLQSEKQLNFLLHSQSQNFNLKKYIKNQNLKLFDCYKFLRKINVSKSHERRNIQIIF